MSLRLALLFSVIILSLVFGGFLHAIVPHDDHAHEYLWFSLHGGLQHDEKKFLFTVLSLVVIEPLFALILLFVLFRAPAAAPAPLREALRRGILPYRRFD